MDINPEIQAKSAEDIKSFQELNTRFALVQKAGNNFLQLTGLL